MKAQLNDDQLKTLLNQSRWNACVQHGKRELIVKRDTYYSFNGEMLTNPKRVIRIRENGIMLAFPPDKKLLVESYASKWVKDENGQPSFQTFPQKYEYEYNDISSFVKDKFFDFEIQHIASDGSIDLTIKNKSTDANGVEVNVEKECSIGKSGITVIEELLKTANFYKYFEKEKRSIGWHVVLEGYNLHLEVVSVNGCTPYLEIEIILVDDFKDSAEKNTCITNAQNVIKKFFKENLNIEEFDGRSWNQIIDAK